MKNINTTIVFSDDIKRILSGVNAFDYNYKVKIDDKIINDIRLDFKSDVNKIFSGSVTIISEEEMDMVNSLISGEYPHCYTR